MAQATVAEYHYKRADGSHAYTVVRGANKQFRTRGGSTTERVPYELPRLLACANEGGTAFVVEGEKDVQRLLDAITIDGWHGFTATTSSHGAAWPWPNEFAEWFRGLQNVWVIADNDAPGRHAAEQRARVIARVVPTVTVLMALPGALEHGDVADWLELGQPLNELAKWCAGAPTVKAATNGHKEVASVRALLASTDPPHDWVVPFLVEREDRIIITGDEGWGKSTLLRQVLVGAAYGQNTFDDTVHGYHAPRTVLLIDLENSERQLRREFRKTLRAVPEERREDVAERMQYVCETSGYVLDNPRDPDEDRATLERMFEHINPDLLVIGPLYKMMGGDPNEERDARELARWLDAVRGTYTFALLIEAHAPHNQQRPYGWSGWKRWPELGMHLDNAGAITHWRGQRDERQWPARLARGSQAGWLWRAVPDGQSGPTAPRDRELDVMLACELDVLRALRKAHRALTRADLVERVPRRKALVLAAIAGMRDAGQLDARELAVTNARGERRAVEAFSINPEREPDAGGSELPDPIGAESAEPPALAPILPFPQQQSGDDDEPTT